MNKMVLFFLAVGLGMWAPAISDARPKPPAAVVDAPSATPPPDALTGAPPHLTLSLAQALDLAKVNSLTYQSAVADERAAEARVVQAGARRLPDLTGNYSFVHTQSAASFQFTAPNGKPLTVAFSALDTNNVSGTLQYALYSGGAVQAAIGEAAAGLAASQSQLAATQKTVTRDVTNGYFQLIETRRAAVIADRAVTNAQQNEQDAEKRLRAGTAARADVLRQQVTLANAQVAAIQAHAAADLDNAALANLLNINLATVVEPSEALELQPTAFQLSDLLNSAQARPEIAAAQDAVTIADEAVKFARAGTLPSVDVQVQEASSKPNFVNVPQPQLSEALSVTWKLFDGGLTHGKTSEARASVDRAQVALQQLKNGVDLEVRQAFYNYQAAVQSVAAAKAAEDSADENLRVSRIRYEAGVGTALELSDALLSAEQAQTQYVSALANLRITLATLQRAAALS